MVAMQPRSAKKEQTRNTPLMPKRGSAKPTMSGPTLAASHAESAVRAGRPQFDTPRHHEETDNPESAD